MLTFDFKNSNFFLKKDIYTSIEFDSISVSNPHTLLIKSSRVAINFGFESKNRNNSHSFAETLIEFVGVDSS